MSLPDPTLREYLTPHPDVTVLEWDLTGEPPLPRIDIVVQPYMGSTEILRSLEQVETGLVQSQSIGYDGVAELAAAGPGVRQRRRRARNLHRRTDPCPDPGQPARVPAAAGRTSRRAAGRPGPPPASRTGGC